MVCRSSSAKVPEMASSHVSVPLKDRQLRVATHQDKERKVCSSIDGADDHQKEFNFDTAAGVLSGKFTGKSGPEGGNRRTLPNEDEDYGKREGDNKDATVHEDAPELGNRENSILEQNATIRVC